MGHYTVPVAIQCTQITHIELQMQFSLKHLYQGLPGGNHLLNQCQRENGHLPVYPTNHQFEAMDRYPFLSTYSVQDNRQSFLALQACS